MKWQSGDEITGAYFFNPFSIEILKQVLNNIYTSVQKNKREIKLYFYYPSEQYNQLLKNEKNLKHIENIDCTTLFKSEDKREYISIYKTNDI
ncbi:MAG: hypothetical protein R3Y05_00795 [bacterium]